MTPTDIWNLRAKARDMQADVYALEAEIAKSDFSPIGVPEHYTKLCSEYRELASQARQIAADISQ